MQHYFWPTHMNIQLQVRVASICETVYASVLTSHPKFAISKKREKVLYVTFWWWENNTQHPTYHEISKDILPFWHILPTHFSICVAWELEFCITVCPHSTRTQQRMIPAKPHHDEGNVYFQCAWKFMVNSPTSEQRDSTN
jgi:hypothetical protein